MDAAQASARKRADYARQEIKNAHIKGAKITEYQEVARADDGFTSVWRFELSCCNIEKIKHLSSHLQTKLSSYIDFGEASFSVSNERICDLRRVAVNEATLDAKQKAEMIARTFGQSIQGLLKVTETESTIHPETNQPLIHKDFAATNGLSEWMKAIKQSRRRICVKLVAVCAIG
ncbi:unnamed protein product [Calicophoron daubneyi]|uniref:Uncharacterized protein n=1 Tax=Calicophoron daubneyi TaxID=300641 RepID=A0AAV2T3T2_CALDB